MHDITLTDWGLTITQDYAAEPTQHGVAYVSSWQAHVVSDREEHWITITDYGPDSAPETRFELVVTDYHLGHRRSQLSQRPFASCKDAAIKAQQWVDWIAVGPTVNRVWPDADTWDRVS